MGSKLELEGKRFGRLVVLKEAGKVKHHYMWECLCDCGNKTVVRGNMLAYGNTKSCGCLQKSTQKTHGLSKTPEYKSWRSIKQRCLLETCKDYKRYGAVGITICDEWVDNFQAFYEHIGAMPKDGIKRTCGRIDNNRGYFPGNVRWETIEEQDRNRSLSSCNNTGINGITRYTHISKVNGKTYEYVNATATLEKHRQVSKNFSLLKMSYEDALQKAIEWRKEMIHKAEELGTFYAPTHGLPKVAVND